MLVYTDRTCQSQLESSCCAPSQACRDDSDCFALVGCVQTCNRDTSCESTCYGDHSSGLGDYDSLQSCIAENLGANCQFY